MSNINWPSGTIESHWVMEEDDEEGYREEDDEEGYVEAKRRNIRPNFSGNVRGVTGGRFNVPGGGSAQVRFDKKMASEQSVKEALAKVSKTIEDVRRELIENNNRIQKQLRRQKNSLNQMQMMSWLPMLLAPAPSTPKIEKIKFDTTATVEDVKTDGKEHVVTATYAPASTSGADNTMTMVMMMMALGGMTGGQSSGPNSENEDSGGISGIMLPMMMLATRK